jgi:hypothetical protein
MLASKGRICGIESTTLKRRGVSENTTILEREAHVPLEERPDDGDAANCGGPPPIAHEEGACLEVDWERSIRRCLKGKRARDATARASNSPSGWLRKIMAETIGGRSVD